LHGVSEIGLEDAEPTQQPPGEIDVIVDEFPPALLVGGPRFGRYRREKPIVDRHVGHPPYTPMAARDAV